MSLDARTTDLAAVAAGAAERLDRASAEEIIEWAVATFGARFCVTSSFADAVLAHLASRVDPAIEVIFLDTGLHFPETLTVLEQARSLAIRVVSIRPARTVAEQDLEHGPRLYARDPDRCCELRKVQPLRDALDRYDAWASGLRRDESPTRANTPVVHFEYARMKVKVNPIARWTEADVASYVEQHRVPVNALAAQGYASIGCRPCTRPVAPGDDPRAGRWAMFDKTECGLHNTP